MIDRQNRLSRKNIFRTPVSLLLALSSLGLTGCTPALGGASTGFDRLAPKEAPTVIGPPVRSNYTPMNPALACLANELQQRNKPKLTIAVDNIRDYTGQYNINEGDAITQGGSLMVMSALGKLGGTINIADRFNTDVTQMELGFMNQRELGDGHLNEVGTATNHQMVPWIPYYGGTILASRYYITGGITELNYNVQSGGAQISVNEIGGKDRVYTEDVGIDLELVDTKTLLVVKTVSLVKQITGFEVGAGIFQFFGSNLWDINIGNKSQEPEQLGVRTLLEDGTLRLVAAAEHISPQPCLDEATNWIPRKTAAQFLQAYHQADRQNAMAPAPLVARTYLVFFDWDSANLTEGALKVVDEAAAASQEESVTEVHVSGYTDTSGSPSYNKHLSIRRAQAVASRLVHDGVDAASISIHGYGATHLLVQTGPGVREAKNRRVEIILDSGAEGYNARDSVPETQAADSTRDNTGDTVNSSGAQKTPNVPPPASASSGTLNNKASVVPPQNGYMVAPGGPAQIKFNYGSGSVSGGDVAEFDSIALTARHRPVRIELVAPANESWSPSKEQSLLDERIDSVRRALQIRGIMHISIIWTPDLQQSGIVMAGSGFQKVAVIVVSQ